MGNLKNIVLVFGACVLLVVLMAIGLSKVSDGKTGVSISGDELLEGARWEIGSKDAKVTVVEFSDIQCPACKATEPIAMELRKMEGVRFVYRHFPLMTIHKNAWKAARAAEAARQMGKGWEMMEMMFDKQESWSDEDKVETIFVGYAKSLGLDEAEFDSKQKSSEVDSMVGEDSSLGNRIKLSGTPTFFVNGEQVGSTFVLDKVKSLLK